MSGPVRVEDGGVISIKRRRRRRMVRMNKEEVPQVCLSCLLFDKPNTEIATITNKIWLGAKKQNRPCSLGGYVVAGI